MAFMDPINRMARRREQIATRTMELRLELDNLATERAELDVAERVLKRLADSEPTASKVEVPTEIAVAEERSDSKEPPDDIIIGRTGAVRGKDLINQVLNAMGGGPSTVQPEPRQDPVAEAVEEVAVVVPEPPAQAQEPRTVELKFTDASTLSPLTERQIKVFNALWKLYGEGVALTTKAIGLEVGSPNVADALSSLLQKRYVTRDVNAVPVIFRPLATGIPQLYVYPTKQKPQEEHKSNGANETHTEVIGDPATGRSAFDKKRLLDELDPVGYLSNKGHTVKRVTSDLYNYDGKTVNLRYVLEQLNIYRTRAKIPAINLRLYL